ncbi:MAG TPA: peptidylprolyl isomerase [Phycisphaerae bacterium]|nr:peptidylprolyl isomerase [Phycisphaerae bacterium]HRR85643.1 peptidylprolyl isomerase [Phycisphaerae bacterium]
MRCSSVLAIAAIVCVVAMVTFGQIAPPGSQPASKAATAPADEVAVVVNDRPIMESEIDRVIAQGRKITPEELAQKRQQIKPQQMKFLFDYIIGNELIVQAAGREGIVLTDQEWKEEFRKTFDKWVQANGWSQEQAAQEIRTRFDMDLAELEEEMPKSPGFRAPILQEKIMQKKFADELRVTDEDVKAYYEQNKANRYTPKEEEVRASHILFATRDAKTRQPMSEEAKQEQRKKAEQILTEAKKPGADFAALAREHSSCPTGKRSGGDLDYFPRTRMVPAFSEAAFAMKVGEISDIVETEFGYHIIKVTGRVEAGETKPFDTVKDQIRTQLEQQKLRTVVDRYKEELKNKAKIVYPPGKEPASPPPVRPVTTRPTTQSTRAAMRPRASSTTRPGDRASVSLPRPQTAAAE